MKKALPSFGDFADVINENLKRGSAIPLKYGHIVAHTMSSFSSIMSSSKGRDKICAIIQYLADFYQVCHKHSNIEEIQYLYNKNELLGVRVANKIKEQMSKSRKIFRFLKFLEEIKKIQKSIENKKHMQIKIILYCQHICKFLYYILDNALWGLSIGVLNEIISKNTEKRWTSWKDFIQFIKVILNIIKVTIVFIRRIKKEDYYLTQLAESPNKKITEEDSSYEICVKLLRQRRKRRFEQTEFIVSVMKALVLQKSLRLPTHQYINPVFVSFCGLSFVMINLIKASYKKQNIVEITKKKNNDDSVMLQQSHDNLQTIVQRALNQPSALLQKQQQMDDDDEDNDPWSSHLISKQSNNKQQKK